MAATERSDGFDGLGARIVAAALLLPGLTPLAQAESPPEQNELALKFLSYEDRQPGLDRIEVSSPAMGLKLRLGDHWSLSAEGVHDSISGASPTYHTAVSGASRMKDQRTAYDLRATRYFERASITAGVNHSEEHDYRSLGGSLEGRIATANQNTVFSLGTSFSNDRINPVNLVVVDARKHTASFFAGVTQVLTPADIVQFDLSATDGRGYYTDPYKVIDNRPDTRRQRTAYLAWNHHLAGLDASLRSGLRFYDDSWGVRAQTLSFEWEQPLPHGLSLTPSLRYTSESAARFYVGPTYDATLGAPFPPGYVIGGGALVTQDQRLSAFGALTAGLELKWQIRQDLSVDAGFDVYQQRGSWRLGGQGSSGLAPLTATLLQTGLTWRF